MQLKFVSRKKLLIAFLAALVFFLAFFYFVFKNFNPFDTRQAESDSALLLEEAIVSPAQESLASASLIGKPLRIKIPTINVDAAVEYVGLTADGAMDVPKSQKEVAWFELSPRPGEKGSAVMAGHYGWRSGQPSAFDNLYKLRPGDKLSVEDDKGTIIDFVVRASRRYNPKADASSVFISNDGQAHLNLITCEGTWDEVSQSYPQRLVIFTDKVASTDPVSSGQAIPPLE